MSFFQLPIQTKKDKSIPKNAFYAYATAKQKQLFVDVVDKIRWQNKLATDTINLEGIEVQEIQIFEIKLKQRKNIESVLPIIEKAIPYHIIFIISFNDEVMLYTSQKHAHPVNENNAVVDWVFKTDWFSSEKEKYQLDLKVSLDKIFEDFCFKISNNSSINSEENLKALIEKEQKIEELRNQISKIETQIKRTKQFNKKQPLNSNLNLLKTELAKYL
ncbi:DUF4391 domain-containing protein [Tenacibaculum haliotis]|uniref:DUF4391 domain-containing protein n=1 Tax=Tenacibaculum haliotis TaxID=1888914 RepID=UPI0021B0409C|nr:DUF4391 domain-containing protein [Tenacibaculum haliotis]MCT4697572.1 DUF4391 domain-containing protein [Tenacibaculum haliotis]